MKVQVEVGGREVVASGSVVLISEDFAVAVKIENLEYIFEFLVFEAPATVTPANPSPKSLKFTLAGAPDVPTQWWYPNVGTVSGKVLSLAFVASTFRGNPERSPGVLLHYTFSAQPVVAGLLGS